MGNYRQAFEIFLYKLTGGSYAGIIKKVMNSFPSRVDYDLWVNRYRTEYDFKLYSDKDVAHWQELLEDLKDPDLVIERLTQENPERVPSMSTIYSRICQKLFKEGLNYYKWKKQNIPPRTRYQIIGDNLGFVAKNIFMEFCQENNLDAGNKLKAHLNTGKRPDNSVFNLELRENEEITIIHIDYTITLNPELIIIPYLFFRIA